MITFLLYIVYLMYAQQETRLNDLNIYKGV